MAGIALSRKKQFATDLGDRWSGFLMAVLDPWTILLLLTTLAFVYGATVQSNKALTAMFSGLAAVCSSIFGGLVTNRWQESAQTAVLVARGKSAIRNLKLLLSSVVGLERRVNCYLDRMSGSDCAREVVTAYLEEVLEKCNTLHEETINAIENWTDIIPEADVTTQIGKIGALQGQIGDLANEAERLRNELDSSRDLSAKEVTTVRQKLLDKESELQGAKKELSTRRTALIDVLSTPVFLKGSSGTAKKQCPNCGEPAWLGPPCQKCGTNWLEASVDGAA
jgi:hypothetical protein